MIGNKSRLPKSLQESISHAEETTKLNLGTQFTFAINYSGKYDIIQACKCVTEKVKNGLIQPHDINEDLLEQELETKCIEYPYPDLLVRTSGELRISNFMLWQLAHTEMFFVKKLFPDFEDTDFTEILSLFQEKRRHIL